MAFWSKLFGGASAPAAQPQAAYQDKGGGVVISTTQQLEEAIRGGSVTASGVSVTPDRAMRVAAVYACVRLRSGVVANMPLHIKRRINERTREDASDDPLWKIFRRRPNRWQTPAQFKRMMQAHLLLRGNAYAMIVASRGSVVELIPLHPDRVKCTQNDDLSLSYVYTRKDGRRVALKQNEVFHLVGLTLDGVNGVSVITYARETIGLSLSMESHGASVFKNGARASVVLRHPGKLGKEGLEFLRASLDDYRAGGESEGKALILEEGMETADLSMTAEDTQWIESRKFSRTDIAMFFGVPPHMIGDTEKSSSWGTGIEVQTQGFVTFSAEDDLTTWEETINRDLIPDDSDLYAKFNRAALVRGDIKARWDAHVKALQWGVASPNEIRALEDMNPREGGDVFYPPPNTAGGKEDGGDDEPGKTTEDR
ncbi:phage portal protein [Sinorhizobium meliloti]|uniref:phage portal protein n=1 Tax=Rhizobium meliloti TaxID=382 RepID=UPI000FD220BF|nr:phage portal protein [Sinorhizobium meliloti]MDW9818182.1 phage portal protein [Sinorhizobium meliloti]MDX0262371.1 phage portal protein [Sinorhizobium meliloti]MDX0351802.1 phage portal protein [Sinorhizobium meliloti]RVI22978.1 phage portal protein [Sinorhizobium meliloti]RVN83461.1 phage portal protein [Sinorhizobium meliloti]